jgi:CheY-like chemotaxis protein
VDRESLLLKVSCMLGISESQARLYDSAGERRGAFPDALERRRDVKPYPIERRRKPDALPGTVLAGAPQTMVKAAGTPAILIVEDNPDNMTTIKAVLQNRYRILEATDGEEGLRTAAEARPDLILLDMALPKMDGLTVVRHLKENRELSQIPVLAMTAQVMKGDRERILDAGCDDYIAKPIDPESFLKKIDEWIKG